MYRYKKQFAPVVILADDEADNVEATEAAPDEPLNWEAHIDAAAWMASNADARAGIGRLTISP